MNIPLPTVKPPVPTVCKMLRTKNAFTGAHDDDPESTPWQFGESSTAVYWCLGTMETFGPDDGLAHPHCCKEGRSCFKVPAP